MPAPHEGWLDLAFVIFCAGPPADALEPKAKQLLNDLKHAQVKILSFLTWMLRTFPTMVAPHQVGHSVPCHLSWHASLILLVGMGIAASPTLRYFFQSVRLTLQDPIASALVRSLQTCPDTVSLRKELLVATRHVLSTPLKAGEISVRLLDLLHLIVRLRTAPGLRRAQHWKLILK